MATQSAIVTQMIQALQLSEPALDTTIGSPVRGVLDVVAEAISEAYADQYLLNYLYDIDAKIGSDLDDFVGVFGFTRYPAKRATGTITFSRQTAATQDIFIPQGAQTSTANTPPVIFQTSVPSVFPVGQTTINVPIQAQLGGTSGNVSAGTITQPVTALNAIATITNQNAMSGGADPESDDQLRTRFKATVFRSLAGTAQMYLAVALDDPDVTRANVVGSAITFTERIEITDSQGVSSVKDLKYFYPNTSYFGADVFNGVINTPGTQYTISGNQLANPAAAPTVATHTTGGHIHNGLVYSYQITARNPAGETLPSAVSGTVTTGSGTSNENVVSWSPIAGATSYGVYQKIGSGPMQLLDTTTFTSYIDIGIKTAFGNLPSANTTASAPSVVILDALNIPDGVYDLQYNYLPTSSRNDVVNNITNRIDVFCSGTRTVEATEDTQFSTAFVFSASSASPMWVGNFQRIDGTQPVVGNYFIPYALGPVNDPALSGEIAGGATNYLVNQDFWLVNDYTPFGLGPQSRSGVEWKSLGNGASSYPGSSGLVSDAQLHLDYSFNEIPSSVQKALQNWRLVTTDIMVHQAKILQLNMYLGVILASASYSASSVLASISSAIEGYLGSVNFNGVVQVSQILSIVQQVPGVVAVRFLTDADTSSILYGSGSLSGLPSEAVLYAIQSVRTDGSINQTFATPQGSQISRAVDVFLTDDTVVNLNDVYLSFMANNSFGAV